MIMEKCEMRRLLGDLEDAQRAGRLSSARYTPGLAGLGRAMAVGFRPSEGTLEMVRRRVYSASS